MLEFIKLLIWCFWIMITSPFANDNMHRGFGWLFFKIFVAMGLMGCGAWFVISLVIHHLK